MLIISYSLDCSNFLLVVIINRPNINYPLAEEFATIHVLELGACLK